VSDDRLSAALRLEVYANAYFYRILDALKEDYGELAAALGHAGFHDLVTAYLLAHPPSHPSLRWAGARLARFLAEERAAEPFRRRWPFAPDLARLEWALVDAFDAADAEILDRDALAALPPSAWADLRLAFHPSVRLLRLSYPVHRMRKGSAAEGAVTPPAAHAPEPTAILVWRSGERAQSRALEPLEADLLEAALGGARFGELCERAAEALGDAEGPLRVAGILDGWVEGRLLARRA
jgi:hypothetical protein